MGKSEPAANEAIQVLRSTQMILIGHKNRSIWTFNKSKKIYEKKWKQRGTSCPLDAPSTGTLPSLLPVCIQCLQTIDLGTPFMSRLSDYLDYYIHKRLTSSEGWENVEVILSDSSVPGEGEHKIIDYIRRQRTQHNYSGNQTYGMTPWPDWVSHVLHGLDADLSMLSLATHEPRCGVLVEQLFVNRCKLCGGADHTYFCTVFSIKFNSTANCLNQPRRTYGKLTKQQRFLNRKLQVYKESSFEFLVNQHQYLTRIYWFWVWRHQIQASFLLWPRAHHWWLYLHLYVCRKWFYSFPANAWNILFSSLKNNLSLIENIKEGAITMLLNIYKRLLPTWNDYIVDRGTIGMTQIRDLLQELDPLEDVILSKRRYEMVQKWRVL